MFRWLKTNLRTLLLAFVLALAVWVAAVTSSNPDVTQAYPNSIPIDFIGQDPGLVMTGTVPRQVQVTLRAPRSVWDEMTGNAASIHAVVDLTGLKAGTSAVDVQLQITSRPVRIVSITPQKFNLNLEKQVTVTLPVEITLTGEPAIGYQAGEVAKDPAEAVISGPESLVAQVVQVRADLDLTNARKRIETSVPIRAVNADGVTVEGISIHPDAIQVNLPIIQQGGYRDLVVSLRIVGKPASGYRMTNYSTSPLTVTVYSSNLSLIESLPGYMQTAPLDLSGTSKSINTHLPLDLPSGILLVGDQTVSVQVEIAPIEDSRQVSFRPVDIIGLSPGLQAELSPTTVDVILAGPLPILNSLQPSDVHVQVDLTGLTVGTYQVTPTLTVVQEGVTVQSINPVMVVVTISKGIELTPTLSITPKLTPTPTR